MIVCLCHRVSDSDIAREVRNGCASFDDLQDELFVARACGSCSECALEVFTACREAPAQAAAQANVQLGGLPAAGIAWRGGDSSRSAGARAAGLR